jgi:hypothetical protein
LCRVEQLLTVLRYVPTVGLLLILAAAYPVFAILISPVLHGTSGVPMLGEMQSSPNCHTTLMPRPAFCIMLKKNIRRPDG